MFYIVVQGIVFLRSGVLEAVGLSQEEQKCQQDPTLVFKDFETPVTLAIANQLTSFNYKVDVFEAYVVDILLWYPFNF